MACLRLYGDPASREDAQRVLAGFGANVEVESGTPDNDLLRRALGQVHSKNPDEILKGTIIVRGRSYIVGADPARVQSLMY
jgi:hypothetical protein